MRKNRVIQGLLILSIVALVASAGVSRALADSEFNFRAHLNGGAEVPARDTLGQGQVKVMISDDETMLSYKLIVANIDNVFAAHIHCAPSGVNGPVGITLFVGAPGGGRFDGVLATGTVTAPDSGNACGWTTLADAIAAIRSGNTYVNVHTNDGVAPPNTGPGDFPGGEIRGQLH